VVEQTAAAPLEATVAAAARAAIEALVEGTTATVDRLTHGIRKAEAIADLVPLLANRATLIALDRSLGGSVIPEPEQAEETRRLVVEVRGAVDRATALTRELEADVSGASAEMRSVRERVARQLETIEPPSSSRGIDEVSRLLDRVREMVQDATRKGERLSATGERGSRAAEGLMRTLEGDAREMAGLITRLAPPTPDQEQRPSAPRPASLRLLDHEEAPPEGRESSRSPGTGEEPR
jgi:hypothetical protein